MVGDNELKLNAATIAEAVQEYLNKRMGEYAPEVLSISAEVDNCLLWFVVQTRGIELQ